jgi:uncharacterized protein (DUF2336 family)
MTLQNHPLFVELEATLTHGAGSQRFTILRRMTDLFLAGSTTYTDEHVAIFDELMGRLIEKIERQALVELSGKLAPAERAPLNVIGRLSRDEDIGISGPILEQSNALTDNDLVEIASTKSQAHLSAIAGRKQIGEPVTDVLIVRGNSEVARKVTTNAGARFSRFGLARAVHRAEADTTLAVAVANRIDLPPEMLDLLIRKATTAVKERLLADARPEMKARIAQVLFEVSNQIARAGGAGGAPPRGRATLRHDPSRIKNLMLQCVASRDLEGLIDALAIHCEVPVNAIKNIVRQESDMGMLVLGKASGIGWPDLQGIVSVTLPGKSETPEDVRALFANFRKLTLADAQRAIRFIRTSTAKSLDTLKELV